MTKVSVHWDSQTEPWATAWNREWDCEEFSRARLSPIGERLARDVARYLEFVAIARGEEV